MGLRHLSMDQSMWTDTTHARHARGITRLLSRLTDAEWLIPEPLLPPRCAQGRPAKWGLREIGHAMLYLLRGGVPYRLLPRSDFLPIATV